MICSAISLLIVRHTFGAFGSVSPLILLVYWQERVRGTTVDKKKEEYLHNESCKFYPLGTCSHGDKCPFPHVGQSAKAATPKAAPKAKAKAKAAAGGDPQQL